MLLLIHLLISLSSATVILLRNLGVKPEMMVLSSSTEVRFPTFLEDGEARPPVAALCSNLHFNFAGKTMNVEEVTLGRFKYSIVYASDLSMDDPVPVNPLIRWIDLEHLYARRVPTQGRSLHSNVKSAARSEEIVSRIRDIVRPAVMAAHPACPLVLLRIGAYGNEQVLTQKVGADDTLPVFSADFIQNFEIDFCEDINVAANAMTVCRLKSSMYDGGLSAKLVVAGVTLTWKNAKSIPEIASMDSDEYKSFLVDFKITVGPHGSTHGYLPSVAVYKATQKYYLSSVNNWLHPITNQARDETVKMTFDEARPASAKEGTTRYSLETLDTFAAAVKLLDANADEKIMVVNFANNNVAGGGYTNGCRAQEEDLFRASDLSFSLGKLARSPAHYPINTITETSPRRYEFSTNALYTPETHIMRERGSWKFYAQPQIQKYKVSVCSIAAFNFKNPNDEPAYGLDPTGKKIFKKGGLDATLKRVRMMFQMADMMGVDTLIVGAFGCGAFMNPPASIVWMFNKAIHEYHGSIKHVQFAIIGQENIDAFSSGIIALNL